AGTVLILRRRRSRPSRGRPESDVSVEAGFAEADRAEDLARRLAGNGLGPASSIAARLSGALAAELIRQSCVDVAELPLRGASLAAVRYGRSSATLMLQQVPMATRPSLIGCLPEAAARAFDDTADVEAMVSPDGDVLVRLTDVEDVAQRAVGDGSYVRGRETWPAPSLLVPLGLLPDRQVFAANWDALGHLLVAAPLGQSADIVLSALVANLVAERSPSQLGLVMLASPRTLPEELVHLP